MTNQQDTALLPVEHWERMIREAAEAEAERENEAESHCGPYGTSTWKDYEKDIRKDFEDIGRAFVALVHSAEADEEVERVARAIWIAAGFKPSIWDGEQGASWAAYMDDQRSKWLTYARAAIAALRGAG